MVEKVKEKGQSRLKSILTLFFDKIYVGIARCFFGDMFKFLTYNLFLPLFIPIAILIGINSIIGISLTSEESLKPVLQSITIYLVVAFFTNIGFWSTNHKIKEIQTLIDETPRKESYVAMSIMLGVISVFLFISSTLNLSDVYMKIFYALSFVLLVISLYFYYRNPLIMHSKPQEINTEGRDRSTEDLSEGLLKRLDDE